VEYLHNLVYQALETIINKKQKEKQSATHKEKVQHGCVTHHWKYFHLKASVFVQAAVQLHP